MCPGLFEFQYPHGIYLVFFGSGLLVLHHNSFIGIGSPHQSAFTFIPQAEVVIARLKYFYSPLAFTIFLPVTYLLDMLPLPEFLINFTA